MSNRHLSRTIVLQSLFEWDFEWDFVGLDNSKVEEILTYNTKEFSTGSCDFEFARKIIDNVIEKRDLIDDIIGKAAPQWPLEKISIIDRNVLRIGISELLFSDRNQVPPKVAINEAIELAKTFGGDNSGRFVSGVLGTIYKELGEPDKDQKTKNKNPIKDIPFEEMPIEKKCGAVVYSVHNDNVFIALVHDVFGHWTLSKGGLEKAEDERDCTVRKIKEEIIALKESPLFAERVKNKVFPVIGEGSHDSQIMFVGEAPGKNEAASGRPFCGAAGKILTELVESIGLTRDEVYVTNIVKDRPPENRDPLPDEIMLYAPFLDRQIHIIQPKVIATLGRFSMDYVMRLLGLEFEIEPISKAHGKAYKVDAAWGTSLYVVPLYHPAAAIYTRSLRETLDEDFKIILTCLL